jgi:hypothetical protein
LEGCGSTIELHPLSSCLTSKRAALSCPKEPLGTYRSDAANQIAYRFLRHKPRGGQDAWPVELECHLSADRKNTSLQKTGIRLIENGGCRIRTCEGTAIRFTV